MKKISPPSMKVGLGFLLSTQDSALSTFKSELIDIRNIAIATDDAGESIKDPQLLGIGDWGLGEK